MVKFVSKYKKERGIIMDDQKKGLSGRSVAFISIAVISLSLFSINFNFYFQSDKEKNGKDNSGKKVAESTMLPDESVLPSQTETSQTEAPSTEDFTDKPVPTEVPSKKDSPTKKRNLSKGKTNEENTISKADLEQYQYTDGTDYGGEDSSVDVQSDENNTENSDNAESSGIKNQERTINVKNSSRLIMMANPEQANNSTGSMTVRRNRKSAANNGTMENDEAVLSTASPDVSPSGEDTDSKGEDPDVQEDQTFSISDVCNSDSVEINDYTNLIYINIQPGEYTITINDTFNDTPSVFKYYLVPDISPLFSDTATASPDEDSDEDPFSETENDDPSKEE